MNKLIGYVIKSGVFTNKNGEEIPYSNRILRLITDTGANAENIGAAGYEIKVKTDIIAQSLKVVKANPAEQELAVNNALSALINKEVRFEYAPINGELTVCGFYPV